ncbi:MAG TPA: hypothetical protein VH309_07015 [Elusimicrobiota bacterium]|nr:hypothetical protein [Elusimicrobiota bacterium]
MDQNTLLVLILVAVVAAIACAVFLGLNQKKTADGFEAAALSQAAASNAELEWRRGKNPRLTLRVRTPDRGQFELRRESAFDRAVEGLSLARAIGTADPEFGERFHIDSDDEAFASAFFSDAAKRSAAQALFAAGFTSLAWQDGYATAVWDGFRPSSEDAGFIAAAGAALRALTAGVPASASAREAGLTEKIFNRCAGIAIVAGFVAVYAAILSARFLPGRPVDGWALFRDSLRASAPLGALFVWGLLTAVRGKTWFVTAAGKALLASALLFPSLGYVGCQLLNSLLDEGAPASFVLPVLDKHVTRGKHTSYYVYVAPWRPGQSDPRFEVGYSTYLSVQTGRTKARLTTRPGRLGREWIVSLGFADS